MATRTADSFVHMNAVIEVNEIRQIMHPPPFNRLARGQALPNRREHWRIGPELGMAGHACFGRGHSGKSRRFNGTVAIAAVDSQAAGMMLMTERNGLLNRNVYSRGIGRPIDRMQSP